MSKRSKIRIQRSPMRRANDIRMKRSQDPRTVLLVEGTTDERVFKKFVNSENCKFVIADGKDNAKSILQILEEDGKFNGFLAIVDSDFEYIENLGLENPNLLLTDSHDLETMIISSSAFERFIGEFGEAQKINAFCECLKDVLLERTLPIGYLRWISNESDLNLSFNGCINKHNIHEQIIDRNTLNIEINNLIDIILKCSPEHKVDDVAKIKEVIESYIKDTTYNPWFVCCGLDIIKSLTIGLTNIFGNDRRGKKVDSEIVDGALTGVYTL